MAEEAEGAGKPFNRRGGETRRTAELGRVRVFKVWLTRIG
jgi:hypothetical protein